MKPKPLFKAKCYIKSCKRIVVGYYKAKPYCKEHYTELKQQHIGINKNKFWDRNKPLKCEKNKIKKEKIITKGGQE